jgi:hypothetical protein
VASRTKRSKVDKKDAGPSERVLLPSPVQVRMKTSAESKKGRVPIVNPGPLLRADLPLALSKGRGNPRAERKRARKLLPHLALQDRVNLRETAAPERSGVALTVVAAVLAARLLGYACEATRVPLYS